MPRLLSTYVFKEMAVPFLICTAVLTLTVLLGKVVKLVELYLTRDVGLNFIAGFIISVIPSFLIYIVPASLLVAVLFALTRLSSESELIAMKASGIGLYSVMRPVALLSAMAFALTLFLTNHLYPWGNHNMKRLLFEAAKSTSASGLTEKTFYDQFKGVVLYVDQIPADGTAMKGIFITDEGSAEDGGKVTFTGTTPKIVFAESGEFISNREDLSVKLRLSRGAVHSKKPRDETYHTLEFSTYTMDLMMDANTLPGKKRRKSNRELYTGELIERINELKASGASGTKVASLTVDLHKRFSLPASVLVFALLGVPLGIQRVRSPSFTGFGLALGVLLVYYVLSKTLEGLGDNALLHPVVAAWGAVILLAGAGLYTFIMAAREKEVIPVGLLEDSARLIARRLTHVAGFMKKNTPPASPEKTKRDHGDKDT